jgi:phosphoribosylformimino-5-aminoimidazole carboxamide ribotide isomerase
MDLIPVLDLSQGQVVRGIAGERQRYAPNVSRLVSGAEPLRTAQALCKSFRPRFLYVADLDGIQTGAMQCSALADLRHCPAGLAVDAGVHALEAVHALLELGATEVIVGLETLPDLNLLGDWISELGPERIVFSLDLRNGRPFGPAAQDRHPMEVAAAALDQGVRRMIVLDLASVGIGRGVTTGALCHSIKTRWPDVILWTGGGVRSMADLHRLSLFRVDGVLVASALHDGRITPADWQTFVTLSSDDALLAMDA